MFCNYNESLSARPTTSDSHGSPRGILNRSQSTLILEGPIPLFIERDPNVIPLVKDLDT